MDNNNYYKAADNVEGYKIDDDYYYHIRCTCDVSYFLVPRDPV